MEDATTMMNLYKAGEIDALYNHIPPAAWIDHLRLTKDHMDKPECAIDYYMLNTTKPPMDDVRVRKAFNMSIDKAGLAAYQRTIKPLTAFSPEGIFPGYPQPVGDPFDPARAKQLLAEAGYRDASGNFDPKKFPIADVELTYNTNERNRQIAEYVQAQWKQNLGLTVPLKNMEWKTFLDYRAKLEYKGVARTGWVGDYMDPYTFLDLFTHEDRRQRHRVVAAGIRRRASRGEPRTGSAEALRAAGEGREDAARRAAGDSARDELDELDEEALRQGHVSQSRDDARLEVRVHRARPVQVVRFIVRRLLVILPMVLVVVSVTWGLIRLAPGNFYTGEKPLPPAIEKNIRERYGLDKPWYVQYGKTHLEHAARRLRALAAIPGPAGQHHPEAGRARVGDARAARRICWRSPSASSPARMRRCIRTRGSTTPRWRSRCSASRFRTSCSGRRSCCCSG